MKKLQITLVRELNELDEHSKSWDKLLLSCPGAGPTQSYAWIKGFLENKLNKGDEWICLFAYDKNELTGVYPLICGEKKRIAGISIQSFTFPNHILHTTRIDGLIASGHEKLLEQFIEKIRVTLLVFPIIRIHSIPKYSSSVRCILKNNVNLSYISKLKGFEDIILLKDDFSKYALKFNSKFRREIHRQSRRLYDKYNVQVLLKKECLNNEDCLNDFLNVEDSGWKGKMGTSIKKNTGDTNLFRFVNKKFGEKGWMIWNFLKADDTIVAAHFGVKINGVVFLWKIGFNEEYSNLAPGNLLLYTFIEDCFADKEVHEINFLNERDWLTAWNVSKRELFDFSIFSKHLILTPAIKLYFKLRFLLSKIKNNL